MTRLCLCSILVGGKRNADGYAGYMKIYDSGRVAEAACRGDKLH
jgi:hypothetical protein